MRFNRLFNFKISGWPVKYWWNLFWRYGRSNLPIRHSAKWEQLRRCWSPILDFYIYLFRTVLPTVCIYYTTPSLVWIHPLIRETGCRQAAIGQIGFLNEYVTLKRGQGQPNLTTSNTFPNEVHCKFNLNPPIGWPDRMHARLICTIYRCISLI